MAIPKNKNRGAKSLTDFVLYLKADIEGKKLSDFENDEGFIDIEAVDGGEDFVAVFNSVMTAGD